MQLRKQDFIRTKHTKETKSPSRTMRSAFAFIVEKAHPAYPPQLLGALFGLCANPNAPLASAPAPYCLTRVSDGSGPDDLSSAQANLMRSAFVITLAQGHATRPQDVIGGDGVEMEVRHRRG